MRTRRISISRLARLPLEIPFLVHGLARGKRVCLHTGERVLVFSTDSWSILGDHGLGGVSYSRLSATDHHFVATRYVDDDLILVAGELRSGQLLWRSALPPGSYRKQGKHALFVNSEAVLLLIEDKCFRLGLKSGDLLGMTDLPSGSKSWIEGKGCLFGIAGLEGWRLGFDGAAERFGDTKLSHLAVANGRLYGANYETRVVSAFEAETATKIAEWRLAPLMTGVFSRFEGFCPIEGSPNLLAVAGDFSEVACVVDLEAGLMRWRSALASRYLTPDGFRLSTLSSIGGLLLMELYSVGTDTDLLIVCNAETGKVGTCRQDVEIFPAAPYLIIRTKRNVEIFLPSEQSGRPSDHLEVTRF